jgi:hypothetical protein
LNTDCALEDDVKFVPNTAPLEDVGSSFGHLIGKALSDFVEIFFFDVVTFFEKLYIL